MPATPAWPPKSLPRLFIRQPLSDGATIPLAAGPINYLGNVLRLGKGAELLLFDGSSGEWLARISEAGRKRMTLTVEQKTREPENIPDVWLAYGRRRGGSAPINPRRSLSGTMSHVAVTQRA